MVTGDLQTTQALQSLERRISELEGQVPAQGRLLKAVLLPDGNTVVVYHGMGRGGVNAYPAIQLDAAFTSGRIELMSTTEAGDASPDPRNNLLLRATGWGTAITLDLWIM